MIADIFEPTNIVNGLHQVFPDTTQLPINNAEWGDYLWHDRLKRPHQAERKQVGEILSGFEHVEDQLRKEMQAHPEASMTLIVEGIAEPVPGGVQIYTLAGNGMVFRKGRLYSNTQYARYEGFLTALDGQGIRVWRTSSWQVTLEALVRFQKEALDESVTIFDRYLRVPQFIANPYVQLLMNLRYWEEGKSKSAGIGEATAKLLIEQWGTPWELFRQEADVIAEHTSGVGKVTAEKILRSIGR